MVQEQLEKLEAFIVSAKRQTYVGSGQPVLPYRLGSHDLQHTEGDWVYHDSYFGGANFAGQEVVYYQRIPVWGMNYFGVLLRPDLTTAEAMGQMIKKSLSHMYVHGRFLGGFEYRDDPLRYVDESEGTVINFTGKEIITLNDTLVYQLHYHGGLII